MKSLLHLYCALNVFLPIYIHGLEECASSETPAASSSSFVRPSYPYPTPAIASGLPSGYVLDSVQFTSSDLAVEIPPYVVVRTSPEFTSVPFPYSSTVDVGAGFGYSAPFRVLSDSGLKKIRDAVDREAPTRAKGNERIPSCLRGLAYLSNAVREYTESPTLLSLFSDLARQPLGVHPISMNIGHTNIGKAGVGYVDQWHTDSVAPWTTSSC